MVKNILLNYRYLYVQERIAILESQVAALTSINVSSSRMHVWYVMALCPPLKMLGIPE